jgi:FtsZ-interacting cell division protein ZipA
MVRTARDLARDLNGDLRDEQGSSWSIQRERFVREEIIQFQHGRDRLDSE